MAATAATDESNEVAPLDFKEAFGPLAHHLFPDGCPTAELQSVWPVRNNRKPVAAQQAIASIQLIRATAVRHGLTAKQVAAVSLAAVATLPSAGGGRRSTAGSPLVDGSSRHFCSLVRSLLPVRNHEMNSDATKKEEGCIPESVAGRLLSAKTDAAGRCHVYQFLTLALRHGDLQPHAVDALYATVFCDALRPATCADAIRMLLIITRRCHVRTDRAARLRACYDASAAPNNEERRGSTTIRNKSVEAIPSLLELYARYDPDHCSDYAQDTAVTRQWIHFPNKAWEQEFAGEQQNSRPTKRQRCGSVQQTTSVQTTLDCLQDSLDGVNESLYRWRVQNTSTSLTVSDQVCDWLENVSVGHLFLLDSSSSEMVRLRTNLPYMLHETWYQQPPPLYDDDDDDEDTVGHENRKDNDGDVEMNLGVDDNKNAAAPAKQSESIMSSRLRLLSALASFVSRTDVLLPEAEAFLLRDVLPLWDGSDAMGQILCHDLLPALSPCKFSVLRVAVLNQLEQLFVYGSARIQYMIVSGALSGLLVRWGRLDWSSIIINRGLDDEAVKNETLKDLIQWTDDLFLKGFLVDQGHELLRAASIDFFSSVCDLTDHCSFVAVPSTPLMYRLLLSPSALHIDRVCHLLVKYKSTFQKLTARQQEGMDLPESGLDRGNVFNCFLWDFCSVLWRCSTPPSPDATGNETLSSILYTDLRQETQSILHENGDKVAAALSITHGAAFAGYAADFLRSQPPAQNQQPSVDCIRGSLKVQYLDYLRTRGLHGIHAFLSTFVASLADRARRQQTTRAPG